MYRNKLEFEGKLVALYIYVNQYDESLVKVILFSRVRR